MAQGDTGASIAYLALGSNLGGPASQLTSAVRDIARIPGTTLLRKSSLYQSPAWGSDFPQPDYLNAVVAVATTLSPLELWQATCRIEQARGRLRNGERNAARTLDIDLLLYDNVSMHDEHLTLPHPRMHQRAFVLRPLADIAPDLDIPGHGHVSQLLHAIDGAAATRRDGVSEWT